MKKDKLSKEERCIHCVERHAEMYRAPADEEFIASIMAKYHGLSRDETVKFLFELKDAKKLDWWEGNFLEGWIVYGT